MSDYNVSQTEDQASVQVNVGADLSTGPTGVSDGCDGTTE